MLKRELSTSSRTDFVDATGLVQAAVRELEMDDGVVVVFNPHTTAAVTINEGADPAVQDDIIASLSRIVPSDIHYKHLEGNSPAHVMTSIIGSSEMVFVENGSLQLGTWQRIFFCEFDGPRSRKIRWRIITED